MNRKKGTVENKPGPGRKKKMSTVVERSLLRIVKNDSNITTKDFKNNLEATGMKELQTYDRADLLRALF